jgi:hypothetical protein
MPEQLSVARFKGKCHVLLLRESLEIRSNVDQVLPLLNELASRLRCLD